MTAKDRLSASVLFPLLVAGCGCFLMSRERCPMLLTYQSLWDEAFEETVVVGRRDLSWCQHRDPAQRISVTKKERENVAHAIELLCAWAARTGTDESAFGEFILVECRPGVTRRVSLTRAGAREWQLIEQIDAVLRRTVADYVPIAESARRNLGSRAGSVGKRKLHSNRHQRSGGGSGTAR